MCCATCTPTVPYSSIGDTQLHGLDMMADIFNNALVGVGVLEPQPMHHKTVPNAQHPTQEPITMWM